MIIVELCVNAYLEFGLVLSTVSGQDLLIFTEHRNTLEGIMSTQNQLSILHTTLYMCHLGNISFTFMPFCVLLTLK